MPSSKTSSHESLSADVNFEGQGEDDDATAQQKKADHLRQLKKERNSLRDWLNPTMNASKH